MPACRQAAPVCCGRNLGVRSQVLSCSFSSGRILARKAVYPCCAAAGPLLASQGHGRCSCTVLHCARCWCVACCPPHIRGCTPRPPFAPSLQAVELLEAASPRIVRLLVRRRWSLADLDSLPFGVALPLRQVGRCGSGTGLRACCLGARVLPGCGCPCPPARRGGLPAPAPPRRPHLCWRADVGTSCASRLSHPCLSAAPPRRPHPAVHPALPQQPTH